MNQRGRSHLIAIYAAVAAALMVGAACARPIGGAGSQTSASVSGEPTWQEPATYTYSFQASCGERTLIGRFEVVVEHGAVIDYRALDEPAGAFPGTATDLPTLGELADRVDEAQRDDDAVVTLETDPEDGHPARIDIDWVPDAIDDEECYVIESYTPGA